MTAVNLSKLYCLPYSKTVIVGIPCVQGRGNDRVRIKSLYCSKGKGFSSAGFRAESVIGGSLSDDPDRMRR